MNGQTSGDVQPLPALQGRQQSALQEGGSVPWELVKPHLTPFVKYGLAGSLAVSARWGMYNPDGSFTESHLRMIGKRMDQAVRLSKQTKAEVAGILGISRAAMTQYCKGESTPTLSNMARFCKATRATMDYIVFGVDPEFRDNIMPMLEGVIEEIQHRGRN